MGLLMYSDYNHIIRLSKLQEVYNLPDRYILDYQELKKGDILYCLQTKIKYIVFDCFTYNDLFNYYQVHIYEDDKNRIYVSKNYIFWADKKFNITSDMFFKKINHINY